MVRVNLTLDNFTDKTLRLIAIESGISRSGIIRNMVRERVNKDADIQKCFDLIKDETDI
ncbi:Ribbon-helix-helix protein, copG family [compost metagenome]